MRPSRLREAQRRQGRRIREEGIEKRGDPSLGRPFRKPHVVRHHP